MPRLDWLDKMALNKISELKKELGRDDQSLKLKIRLPMFNHTVLYQSASWDSRTGRSKAQRTTKITP